MKKNYFKEWFNEKDDQEDLIVSIIENSERAAQDFGYRFGADIWLLSRKHIQALLEGKAIAFLINGGEYSGFMALDE